METSAPKTPVQISALILRVLLGARFLWTGGAKIFVTGLDRFVKDIANYRMVNPPWDAAFAWIIPWLEVCAGLCLMLSILRRGAIVTLTGLVVAFSLAIAWAWKHNLNIACGCYGSNEPINYWGKAAEFFLYFAILAFLWFAERRQGARSSRWRS